MATVRSASTAVRRTLQDILGFIPQAEKASLVIEDTLHPASGTADETLPHIRLVARADGAEDVTCPVTPNTLAQRIAARLEKGGALAGGWRHDASGRQLLRDGQPPVTLTEKESLLLSALLAHHPEPCKRDALLKDIWAYGEQAETHTLETHIYRLRSKLAALEPRPCDIVTLDGSYRLATDER